MTLKLKLHDEYAQHRNNKDKVFVVRFNDGLKAAIVDKYCTVPDCNCATIRLEFNEVNESGSFLGKLFSLSLDTETWEVSELQCENVNVDCEGLLKEFVAGLDASLKETFRTRAKLAKKSGNGEVLDWLDDEKVTAGLCFSYAQVYGERDAQAFIFEYKDREYFVDDQYCSNPKCKCNEAILSFINIISDRDKLEPQFVLRVSLATGDYEIEFCNAIDQAEIQQVYARYREHVRGLGLLKSRYAKMKEFGVKRSLRKKERDMPRVASYKLGRNDPCPCGSGKKYKKCCGLTAE